MNVLGAGQPGHVFHTWLAFSLFFVLVVPCGRGLVVRLLASTTGLSWSLCLRHVQVRKPDFTLTYHPKKNNDCLQSSYEHLSTSESKKTAWDSVHVFILKLPKLSEEDKNILVLRALTCLQSCKSPGLDDYMVKFYKKFQLHLVDPLMGMPTYY